MNVRKFAKRGMAPSLFSLILVLAFFSAGIGVAAAANPIVSISPSASTVNVGQDFSVYISVDPAGNALEVINADLGFDSSLVSLTVSNGGMFTTMFHPGTMSGDNVADITGLDPGVSTPGNLAVLQMHADSAGTFTLDLSDVTVATGSGSLTPVVNDGSVTINVVDSSAPVVSISPSASTVNVGQDFSVYISVDPAGNALEVVNADLGFDSSLVSLTVSNGGMFTTMFHPGTMSGDTVADITGLDTGVSTPGNFAVLQMHADSAGTFTLDLSDVTVSTGSGSLTPVVNDGSVTINVVDSSAPVVSISPSASFVNVGDDFSVYISVDPAGNALEVINADLGFDSSLVSLTVSNGGMFTTMFHPGTMSGDTVADITGLDTGVSTPGNLAVLQMHADSAGTFTLDLSDVTIATGSGSLTPVINDGTVTINPIGTHTIQLCEGWNLFSVPRVLSNDSVEYVLDGVDDVEAIIGYDANTQNWFIPTSITPLTAFAIKMSASGIITDLEYMPGVPPSRQMYEGWNLVGLTGMDQRNAEFTFGLGGIDDNYSKVWGPWDCELGDYAQHGYNENVHGQIDSGIETYVYTDDYIMNPFEGHWIKMTDDAILEAIA